MFIEMASNRYLGVGEDEVISMVLYTLGGEDAEIYVDKIALIPVDFDGVRSDSLDPDSDSDGIIDGDELHGDVPRYVKNKGVRGYDFSLTPKSGYTFRTFSYHTNPFNEDSDYDGVNDKNDSIPLDYDMDGDGLACKDVVKLISSYDDYVPRLGQAFDEDDYIDKNNWDNDIDDDGLPNTGDWPNYDSDDDADGMDDSYEFWHGTHYGGWQNRYIHNERYAIIIAGGGDDPKEDVEYAYPKNQGSETSSLPNLPAFWKNSRKMYDKLRDGTIYYSEYPDIVDTDESGYFYKDDNIYMMYSDWNIYDKINYETNWRVDGECTWNFDGDFGIDDAIKEIGKKVTLNDFITFVAITHGHPDNGMIIHSGNNNNPIDYLDYQTLADSFDANFGGENNPKKYARMSVILQSSFAYLGLMELGYGSEGRITISATCPDEYAYTSYDCTGDYKYNSFAFIDVTKFYYDAIDGIPIYCYYYGFLKWIHCMVSPNNINYAFEKGYEAARHNGMAEDLGGGYYEFYDNYDLRSTPQIYWENLAEVTYL